MSHDAASTGVVDHYSALNNDYFTFSSTVTFPSGETMTIPSSHDHFSGLGHHHTAALVDNSALKLLILVVVSVEFRSIIR